MEAAQLSPEIRLDENGSEPVALQREAVSGPPTSQWPARSALPLDSAVLASLAIQSACSIPMSSPQTSTSSFDSFDSLTDVDAMAYRFAPAQRLRPARQPSFEPPLLKEDGSINLTTSSLTLSPPRRGSDPEKPRIKAQWPIKRHRSQIGLGKELDG